MFGHLVCSSYSIPIRKTSYHLPAALLFSQINSVTDLNCFSQIRNAGKNPGTGGNSVYYSMLSLSWGECFQVPMSNKKLLGSYKGNLAKPI